MHIWEIGNQSHEKKQNPPYVKKDCPIGDQCVHQ